MCPANGHGRRLNGRVRVPATGRGEQDEKCRARCGELGTHHSGLSLRALARASACGALEARPSGSVSQPDHARPVDAELSFASRRRPEARRGWRRPRREGRGPAFRTATSRKTGRRSTRGGGGSWPRSPRGRPARSGREEPGRQSTPAGSQPSPRGPGLLRAYAEMNAPSASCAARQPAESACCSSSECAPSWNSTSSRNPSLNIRCP